MSVELYSGSTSHKQKIPESMIQKKRELHLSYSQAFGVARITDKFRPRYSAGVHLIYGYTFYLFNLCYKGAAACSNQSPFRGQSYKK